MFGENRVPDTLEGRFELMALNGALALIRLKQEAELGALAQAFVDCLFRQFDAGLREEGVGDTSVPKRMHKLAGEFYGRAEAYGAAISERDPEALAAAISRNALKADAHPFAPVLAAYALAVVQTQARQPPEALFEPDGWPAGPG